MASKKKEEVVGTVDVLSLKNDLVKYIDEELDQKVDSVFTQKIRKEFLEEIDNANRKIIKEKNKKIFARNVLIFILLFVVGFLIYLLYDNHYFDKYFVEESTNPNVVEKEPNKIDKNDDSKPDLEELKNEYSLLMDNIQISKNSIYLEDYYGGNLSEELKMYLALNTMNFDSIEVEEEYHIISSDTLKIAYHKLFNGEFVHSNFEYNGNRIRYFSKLDSYVTDYLLEKDNTTIKREIIGIEVVEDNILITTIEGIVEDEKLYNILTKEEIEDYHNDSISNYQDRLNKVTYTFHNSKLISIK